MQFLFLLPLISLILHFFKMNSESTFLKITQGSFHQGNIEKFGLIAGRKCTCCALFSVAFSVVKNPGFWDTFDIDYVVENGDRTFKVVFLVP